MMKNPKNSRENLKTQQKTLKTQGENSKSRHFLDRWMPEKRSKRKPDVCRPKFGFKRSDFYRKNITIETLVAIFFETIENGVTVIK